MLHLPPFTAIVFSFVLQQNSTTVFLYSLSIDPLHQCSLKLIILFCCSSYTSPKSSMSGVPKASMSKCISIFHFALNNWPIPLPWSICKLPSFYLACCSIMSSAHLFFSFRSLSRGSPKNSHSKLLFCNYIHSLVTPLNFMALNTVSYLHLMPVPPLWNSDS